MPGTSIVGPREEQRHTSQSGTWAKHEQVGAAPRRQSNSGGGGAQTIGLPSHSRVAVGRQRLQTLTMVRGPKQTPAVVETESSPHVLMTNIARRLDEHCAARCWTNPPPPIRKISAGGPRTARPPLFPNDPARNGDGSSARTKSPSNPRDAPSPIQTAFGWDVDGRFRPIENSIPSVRRWEQHPNRNVDSVGSRDRKRMYTQCCNGRDVRGK